MRTPATATIRSAVNLGQLAHELSSTDQPAPLSVSANGAPGEPDYECVVTCHDPDVTDADLQAALDTHVPAPPPPTQAAATAELLDDVLDELMDKGVI